MNKETIASKTEALHKAGLHPVSIAVILVLSTPGVLEYFFNKTGERADTKAEIAYEVMANEVKHLRADDEQIRKENERLREQVDRLRDFVRTEYTRRRMGRDYNRILPEDVEEIAAVEDIPELDQLVEEPEQPKPVKPQSMGALKPLDELVQQKM